MCSDITPTVPTHKYELLDMRDYPLDAEITYMCCVGRYSLNLILGYSNTFLWVSITFLPIHQRSQPQELKKHRPHTNVGPTQRMWFMNPLVPITFPIKKRKKVTQTQTQQQHQNCVKGLLGNIETNSICTHCFLIHI